MTTLLTLPDVSISESTTAPLPSSPVQLALFPDMVPAPKLERPDACMEAAPVVAVREPEARQLFLFAPEPSQDA